jgi:hydrogenase maturation protein HypF
MHTDDSVVRPTTRTALMLRRSRGYVPRSIGVPIAGPPLVACGAQLKNTFCVARDASVGESPRGRPRELGDAALVPGRDRSFRAAFAVTPSLVAHDLHPGYLSTAKALARDGVEHVGVQHHHAHLAACLAEHGERGPAVGAIFDGTGYGDDGTIWGGELLVGGLAGFERAGMLWPARLPGGEQAIREPWRMACAWLVAAEADGRGPPGPLARLVDAGRWREVAALARRAWRHRSPPARVG